MDRRSLTNLLLPVLLLMSSGVAASECDARNPIRNPILRTFNVRTYGAKGDGKTNDTAAIKAAITAAGIGTGNTVLFPEGDYLYDQELTVNGIFLRGESGARLLSDSINGYVRMIGRGGSVSDLSFGLPVSINGKLIPLNLIIVEASNSSVVRNRFSLGFDPLVRHYCIYVQHAVTVLISDNVIGGPGGLLLKDTNNCTVTGNRIFGSQLVTSITFHDIGVVSDNGTNNSITNNTIICTTDGKIPTAGVIVENKDAGTTVSGNTIQQFTAGLVVQTSSNCRLLRNTIESGLSQFTRGVIDLEASGNVVADQNTISQASNDGIRSESMTGALTISRNKLRNCGVFLGQPASASVIYNDSPSAVNIRIEGNEYTGETSGLNYFIECLQPSPPAVISGNSTNTLLRNRIGP